MRFGPAASLSLALIAPGVEPWLGPLLAEPGRHEIRLALDGGTLEVDLYRPPAPRGALLLVHGLSPAGRRHPDLVRLARLLAAHGQLVMVPHVEGLAAFRLSGREVDEIRLALRHLQGLHGSVGIAGFSFGAGPALLAAAEAPALRLAGSFGGYASLDQVIGFITTGAHAFGGRRYVQAQEEYNRWKLLALLTGFVQTARDRALLEALVARKLADPAADAAPVQAALGEEGRAMLALVLNRDEAALGPLLAGLPPEARRAMSRLSPLAALPRIAGRILIAHGADDRSIPFTESLRLAEAAEGRARVAILHTFQHTAPGSAWRSLPQAMGDGWGLLGLVDDMLRGG
jgi:pimeloyl-ACP methyl ester carboxylesterase